MDPWEGTLALCKQGVAGSIPATSTNLLEGRGPGGMVRQETPAGAAG